MGVTGLLPCLRSISHQVSLEKYRGLTVGVDAMCWLHKAIYASDPIALAKIQFRVLLNRNETDGHIARNLNFNQTSTHEKHDKVHSNANRLCAEYVVRQAQMLIEQYEMNIILVVDGAPLPIKQSVNKKRIDNRYRMFHEAIKAETIGDHVAARKLFAQSCSISDDIKLELLRLCGQQGIAFVVAPYEADAQLAKLAQSSYIDCVLTEDSDLLLYGCPRVLFKADLRTGTGVEIQILRDLGNNEKPSFHNWTHDMFIYMCILSGCDYCEGVSGLGLQTAHKLVRIHRTPQKLLTALARDGRLSHDFEQMFWMAFKTFRHQRVYCLEKNDIDFLFPLEAMDVNVDDWDFLGYWMEPETSGAVASGILHPESKVPWVFSVNDNCPLRDCNKIDRIDKGVPSCVRDDVDFSFFSKKRVQVATMECIQQQGGLGQENISAHNLHNFTNDSGISANLGRTKEESYRGTIRPRVPIHFEDYTSSLIGPCFETLSRSQRRNNPGKRFDFRKALERVRYKTALQLSHKPIYQPQRQCHQSNVVPECELIADSSEYNSRKQNQDFFKYYNAESNSNVQHTCVPVDQKNGRSVDFSISRQYIIDEYHDQKLFLELLQENPDSTVDQMSSKTNTDKAQLPSERFDMFCNYQSLPVCNHMFRENWTHYEESTTLDDDFTLVSRYRDCDSLTFNNQSCSDREIVDMNFISDINRLVDL